MLLRIWSSLPFRARTKAGPLSSKYDAPPVRATAPRSLGNAGFVFLAFVALDLGQRFIVHMTLSPFWSTNSLGKFIISGLGSPLQLLPIFIRGEIPQTAVWPLLVVMLNPGFNDSPGMMNVVEYGLIQAFIP